MIIKDAKFITSVADRKGILLSNKPIIAICGKSNVGKSSIINMLANKKGLARTSVTPGRTRLINYFDFGEFILADLPGYGFAKVSDSEKKKWAKLMEEFFATENALNHVIMLVDIRHEPTRDDLSMINYLHSYALPFTVVATKADKIGKTRIYGRVQEIGNYLAIGGQSVIATSSETGYGKDKLLQKLQSVIEVFNSDFFAPDEEDLVEETE
ncbi:MAG: YihA family ribosome biogenesis GTP-binding protein [Clostridia bacterium]|nr:YihA family ribosome biogenesis GTP-binding protein [Clostridia bacterium]